ncbi:putative zinc-binding protein [Halomonas sp. WWR20]
MKRNQRPLIYSCSGCSDVAQLANEVAVRLDHAGTAQMSCIAGVGGGVEALIKIAHSGRPVIGIDGCPLHCVQSCLEQIDQPLTEHVKLYDMGYRKHHGRRYREEDIQAVTQDVGQLIARLSC